MNIKDKEILDSCLKEISDMKSSLNTLIKLNTEIIQKNENLQKQSPIQLERQVISAVENSITEALYKSLTEYNSPLLKYSHIVVEQHELQIKGILNNAINQVVTAEQFTEKVREVLLQKVTKTIISGIDGAVEKVVNQIKQDAIYRSRLTLTINQIVENFINEKSTSN